MNAQALMLQASVAKVLHSAAFGRAVSNAMLQALAEANHHGDVVLPAPGPLKAQYTTVASDGQPVMLLTASDGFELCRLYRDYHPDGVSSRWHPSHWWGSQSRRAADGSEWSSSTRRYVCDDFGDLVQVTV